MCESNCYPMISPCRTPVCLKTHHSSSNRPRPHHAAPAHSWLLIPSHPTASTEEAEGNHVGKRGIKTPSNIFDVCCMCERGWENKLPFLQMRESDSSVSQWRRQWEVKGPHQPGKLSHSGIPDVYPACNSMAAGKNKQRCRH